MMTRLIPSPDRVVFLAVLAASVLVCSSAVLAQDAKAPTPNAGAAPEVSKVAPATPTSATPVAPSDEAPAVAPKPRPLSPMMAEMQTVLAAESERLAELKLRAGKAPTPDDALAIQREIERVKFDTEVSLLRVQAKHARQAGRTEVASRIESAIADLVNPSKPVAPAARPVPSRENPSH
jgi:hypothetical protein